jgi:ABC-type uncharacterized transport system, permease component
MPIRARAALGVVAALVAAVLLWRFGFLAAATEAALALHRDLHNGLARAAHALAQGDAASVWSHVGMSALYGADHAAGPGHGKALVGVAAFTGAERPLGFALLGNGGLVGERGNGHHGLIFRLITDAWND